MKKSAMRYFFGGVSGTGADAQERRLSTTSWSMAARV
jgi:hypothetical protein